MIPGPGRSPGEGNGYPSSILAGMVLQAGDPGGLPSMGAQRVRHDWATDTFTFAARCQPEFAIGVHMSPPSRTSLPPPTLPLEGEESRLTETGRGRKERVRRTGRAAGGHTHHHM